MNVCFNMANVAEYGFNENRHLSPAIARDHGEKPET